MFKHQSPPSYEHSQKGGPLNTLANSTMARLVAAAAIFTGGIGVSQFADLPAPFCSKSENNRAVNSLSAIVAGVVAQKIRDSAEIDLTVQKPFFADAKLHGTASANQINAAVDLAFTKSQFQATKNESLFKGTVDKSEWNWEVTQIATNEWQIARFGPKFDSTLHIIVENGEIQGVLERTLAYDWAFHGTYDEIGNVRIEFNRPWLLDFELQGKIEASK